MIKSVMFLFLYKGNADVFILKNLKMFLQFSKGMKRTLLLGSVMMFTWRGGADPCCFAKKTRGGPSAFEDEGDVLVLREGRGAFISEKETR